MNRKCPPKSRQSKMARSLLHSPNYIPAYRDPGFLAREELRPVRLQLELLKPEMSLVEQGIESTVVVFGSARINDPASARRRALLARRALSKRPKNRRLQEALSTEEHLLALSRYYEEARRFGSIVTRASQDNGHRHFVIVTGGGPGIMEAANRGAWEAGGKSIGLNITLPHEQVPNAFVTPELCFRFHYFAIRKMHFLMRAKAMVAFPGGFGTFDELFETLTLVQTLKKRRLPIILVGKAFWDKVLKLEELAEEGVISSADIGLIRFVETAQEAWRTIRDYWRKKGNFHIHQRRSFSALTES